MPRPRRCRRVCCDPAYQYFKPRGVPLSRIDRVELGLDEFEAVRLADFIGMSQTEAAKSMDVSQPTFNRIVATARAKVAKCLVEGLALKISSPEDAISTDSISIAASLPDKGGCGRGSRQ